jgi:hypothetical protein
MAAKNTWRNGALPSMLDNLATSFGAHPVGAIGTDKLTVIQHHGDKEISRLSKNIFIYLSHHIDRY